MMPQTMPPVFLVSAARRATRDRSEEVKTEDEAGAVQGRLATSSEPSPSSQPKGGAAVLER